ncbi:MAG: SEC-C domain-containing protein, partial [Asticcacaulis sp.]|nr:SEC-C domain-containing protein [Asticcacaulis sp.]
IWQPWAQGFGAAVGEFAEGFEPLVALETELGESLRMLIALIGIATEDPDLVTEMGQEAVDELGEAAPDLIPECVYALFDGKLEASGALQPRTVTTIGRNDPCTCGSGKKYKKCCGAAD